jgi:uncharacterized surface protein with fasciclin (FAS1) repeats
MSLKHRVIRFAVALSIAGAISAQIPLNSGTALAADDYGGGGGGGGRTIIQATVFALVGYGIYSTITGAGAPAPTSTTPDPGPGGFGAAPGTKPIYDVCAESEDLNTFAKAADAAGLKDKLRDPGPYTAFVPTNMAFNQLDQNVLTDLLKPENKDKLAAIVSFHVINGSYTIEQLKNETQRAGVEGFKTTTINNQALTITNDGGLKVNGVAVTESDIQCSNGIIHPLQAVLMPPADATGGTATPPPPAEDEAATE